MEDRFRYRIWNKTQNKWLHFDFSTYLTYQNWIWQALADGESLCPCTNLKDKNGKLIYEGDILGGIYHGYIAYCPACKCFQFHIKDYGCLACEGDLHWYELVESESGNELEVIGNIYENPKLLDDEVSKNV